MAKKEKTPKAIEIKPTEVDLKDLKERASQVLAYCRGQVLQKHPFTGTVAMNLDLIPVRDFRCSTAMTDGTNVFFDIDFLSRLTQDEREFVIAHEVWHNVMLHFARKGTRQATLFNYATDFEVNQLLEKDGFVPPKDVLFPNGRNSEFNYPSDLSAEEYYELLLKDMPKQAMTQSGEGEGEGDGKSGGKGGKGGKNGKGMKGQFDDHYDPDKDYEKEAENIKKAISDKYGVKGVDPDFKPASSKDPADERRRVERMREATVSAAQQVERSRGELPAYISKIVKDLLQPQVNWKELLSKSVTTAICNKVNWNMPNKRFAYTGTYLPRHQGESVKLAIGVDTSGSCAQDVEKFLTEIVGIATQFDGYELHVIQCDTEIKGVDTFDESNPLDPVHNGIEFKGFGGTELAPIFKYITDNDLDVDQIIVFTDGYCDTFKADDAPAQPVTWVITCNDGKCENLGFGDKIYLKD